MCHSKTLDRHYLHKPLLKKPFIHSNDVMPTGAEQNVGFRGKNKKPIHVRHPYVHIPVNTERGRDTFGCAHIVFKLTATYKM